MKPSLLSWICSVLTLHSVSSADGLLSFTELPNEMQLAIMDQVDFCDYIEGLKIGRGVPTNTDVGMAMLADVAKEERNLDLEDYKQRVMKQRLLKSVRTFVRIRSRLPIVCKTTDKEELEHRAQVLESTYRDFSSFSESPTWKKACMAGLFGRNTLITLLPHLSEDFCSHNKALLLQTAFFIGDIDSLRAIVDTFEISKEEVLTKVPEVDIVFSGSVDFFNALLEHLPNLMTRKSLGLIKEACSLNRLNILLRILEVAEPVEREEPSQIVVSFYRLEMVTNDPIIYWHSTLSKLFHVLLVAAQHGHLPIIRFLWPLMETIPNEVKAVVKGMMTRAGEKDHRSVLEFLLWQSGVYYMEVAQDCVNDAFEAAVGQGRVAIMEFLTGKDKDGQFVAPGLSLTKLSWTTLSQAIKSNENWDGIQYLVDLKKKGDSRFANFELVDQDNTALCYACEVGNYKLVEDLLCRTDDGEFVFPLTNPAVRNNQPLVKACLGGNVQIVQKLLERDVFGKYIYKGIDPSAQIYGSIVNACSYGHVDIVEFLLKMRDGKYVLPRMNGVDLTRALLAAIEFDRMKILEFLLAVKNGKYVLPGMSGVNFTRVLSAAIYWDRMEIVQWLLSMNKSGKYALPGMNDVDLNNGLSDVIRWNKVGYLKFLLRMEGGNYVLPVIKSVDFTRALLTTIESKHMDILKWLLSMNKVGKYVLPGMNNVDLSQALSAAITRNRIKVVRFLLRMNKVGGEYVLPGMTSVDFTRALSIAIESKQIDTVRFLLSVKEDGKYVVPGMRSVNFTSVLLDLIKWGQMDILKWLLSMNGGEYFLPGVNGVDFTRVLSTAIEWEKVNILKWLLSMNGGEYILPGMNGVDFIEVLSSAISWKRMGMVRFLLTMKEGKYVLPGIRVTEDMLTTVDPSPEMTNLLEKRLGQQRIDVEKHVMWFISTK